MGAVFLTVELGIWANFWKTHAPILFGKLSTRLLQNAARSKDIKGDVGGFRFYNKQGVSFPFGDQLPPSSFGQALISDPAYQKIRALSTRERWALTGGAIIPPWR